MKRVDTTTACVAVRARALAGESLAAHETAHAFHCAPCAAELELIRGLESAGRALHGVRTLTVEDERSLSRLGLQPHTRRAQRLAFATAALVVVVIAGAVAFWPRAPSHAPTTMATQVPVAPPEALVHLLEEAREIRAGSAGDDLAPAPLEWQLPTSNGVVQWTVESTPVEALLPPSYGWLSEVLSASTL